MAALEVKRTPDGKILARRRDRKPLTPEDMEEAKRLAEREVPACWNRGESMAQDDPILPVEAWLPIFLDYQQEVAKQVADFNIWGWARTERPELYTKLKAAESDIDNLSKSSVHLSEVMKVIRRGGDSVLQVQFEQGQKK